MTDRANWLLVAGPAVCGFVFSEPRINYYKLFGFIPPRPKVVFLQEMHNRNTRASRLLENNHTVDHEASTKLYTDMIC